MVNIVREWSEMWTNSTLEKYVSEMVIALREVSVGLVSYVRMTSRFKDNLIDLKTNRLKDVD